MLKGFWTTMPCNWLALSASMKAWLESKPTNETLPALPMSCSASVCPAVEDSFGVKMPPGSGRQTDSADSQTRASLCRAWPAY